MQHEPTDITTLQAIQSAVGHSEQAMSMLARKRKRGTIENKVHDTMAMADLVDKSLSLLSAIDQLPAEAKTHLMKARLSLQLPEEPSEIKWRSHLFWAHQIADELDTYLVGFVVKYGRAGETWDRLRGAEEDYQAAVRDLALAKSFAGM